MQSQNILSFKILFLSPIDDEPSQSIRAGKKAKTEEQLQEEEEEDDASKLVDMILNKMDQ